MSTLQELSVELRTLKPLVGKVRKFSTFLKLYLDNHKDINQNYVVETRTDPQSKDFVVLLHLNEGIVFKGTYTKVRSRFKDYNEEKMLDAACEDLINKISEESI